MDNTLPPARSATRIKRHYRTAEEKRRIVEETLVPGISVAVVARARGSELILLLSSYFFGQAPT
jgi:transposase-like protein